MNKLEHAVPLRRFVSMSEFARQGARELRKQDFSHCKFEFEIADDMVLVNQVMPYMLQGYGVPSTGQYLARNVLTVRNDYDYWCAGRSRVTELHALGAVNKHNKAALDRSAHEAAELKGDTVERLEWAIKGGL